MAIAVAINAFNGADPAAGIDATRSKLVINGALTLTANYGGAATHGDTMSLQSPFIDSDLLPESVRVYEQPPAGTAPLGKYIFVFCPGTTQANGVLFIYDTSTDAEYAEGGAYNAGLLAAVLRFEAIFPKL